MAILDLSGAIWHEALGISEDQVPHALILEGTWWRQQATEKRLGMLEDVQELAFPEMYTGRWQGARVAYCCAYGAARAVEPAHIFAQLGTPLLIQIGTCGTLDAAAGTGLVVLPETCVAADGISPLYGAADRVLTDPHWVGRAEHALHALGIETQRCQHLTWPSLFAQSDEMCRKWAAEGLLSIDMEASVVAAVARHFGVSAIALLAVWDALPHGRTFLDPLDKADADALAQANQATFDAALQLAAEIASRE